MPDIEVARAIMAAARRDLQALENMLDPLAFPGEIFGFHAQQAAEKALTRLPALPPYQITNFLKCVPGFTQQS